MEETLDISMELENAYGFEFVDPMPMPEQHDVGVEKEEAAAEPPLEVRIIDDLLDKGGESNDWEESFTGTEEYVFNGTDVVHAVTGESWLGVVEPNSDEALRHQEMMAQFGKGGEQFFRLPDAPEETPEGEEKLHVTYMILNADRSVTYKIYTTSLGFKNSEEPEFLAEGAPSMVPEMYEYDGFSPEQDEKSEATEFQYTESAFTGIETTTLEGHSVHGFGDTAENAERYVPEVPTAIAEEHIQARAEHSAATSHASEHERIETFAMPLSERAQAHIVREVSAEKTTVHERAPQNLPIYQPARAESEMVPTATQTDVRVVQEPHSSHVQEMFRALIEMSRPQSEHEQTHDHARSTTLIERTPANDNDNEAAAVSRANSEPPHGGEKSAIGEPNTPREEYIRPESGVRTSIVSAPSESADRESHIAKVVVEREMRTPREQEVRIPQRTRDEARNATPHEEHPNLDDEAVLEIREEAAKERSGEMSLNATGAQSEYRRPIGVEMSARQPLPRRAPGRAMLRPAAARGPRPAVRVRSNNGITMIRA